MVFMENRRKHSPKIPEDADRGRADGSLLDFGGEDEAAPKVTVLILAGAWVRHRHRFPGWERHTFESLPRRCRGGTIPDR